MSREPSRKPHATTATQSPDTTGESSPITPASSSLGTPPRSATSTFTTAREVHVDSKMDETDKAQTAGASDRQDQEDSSNTKAEQASQEDAAMPSPIKKRKSKCKKPEEHKSRKRASKASKKKTQRDLSTSDSSSSSESEEDTSSSDSSDDLAKKRKLRDIKNKDKRRRRKSKKVAEDSESDSSDIDDASPSADSSSSDEEPKLRRARKSKSIKKSKDKKSRKLKKSTDPLEDSAANSDDADTAGEDLSLKEMQAQLAELTRLLAVKAATPRTKSRRSSIKIARTKARRSRSTSSTPAVYKRVDQLWDSSIHNYKLKESAEDDDSEFAEFAFLVRRTFDWENKYRDTVVDIKSKVLRLALAEVMKDCKSVALEAEEPVLDPNILFLYLEELRTYYKKTLKAKIKAERKRKAIKKLEQQRSLVKVLVGYIDEDYADTKKTLYPLLKAGNITFDLLWALFKPNEIAITSCYGVWDEARCFKVDYANKCQSMTRGEWYCIEGRYLEYDGKSFGFGDFEVDVEAFKGPRKISSLATYPLKYHREPEKIRKHIIDRSEKFVGMEGMHYKFHKGLAFMKKKKQVLKININGRVMVDPATFRRVNPNYPISCIKAKEDDDLFSLSGEDDSDDGCSCGGHDSEDELMGGGAGEKDLDKAGSGDSAPKYKYKWTTDSRGHMQFVAVEVDDNGDPLQSQRVDKLEGSADDHPRTFTEEELLLTSPVMLGFAFSEKLWLEFTISGIHDIVYNNEAFDSLVLPPNQKSIVRAQVESHKFYAAKTIDDVVQGKGKGLVAVLHGPPGTGKTLTAEGIAELLKCPLYMVSAGELGTDPAKLEYELQKILDIAHSWGAVLLLDEADVFLEKREVHDIHRNALVSIFLRLLEYFQGILFLTTNRVETFDDAFQSRIHIALRYSELTPKARKAVWKMFLERVKAMDGLEVADITDKDLEILAKNQLNGRQIKNLVRTAQALALNEKSKLTMEHIKRVIDVAETFDRDLKGGTGYVEAMRSYT